MMTRLKTLLDSEGVTIVAAGVILALVLNEVRADPGSATESISTVVALGLAAALTVLVARFARGPRRPRD